MPSRHVIALAGGKDSAALALYMNIEERDLDEWEDKMPCAICAK